MKTTKIFRVLLAAALFQFIALASSAQITMLAFIKGQKQGEIKGDAPIKAQGKGTIECFGYTDEVVSPRDAASGLPTGKRMHKPITITTHFDSSTPRLLEAAYTNENLTNVTLELFRVNAGGQQALFATIELVNASVASIDQVLEKGSPAEKPMINVRIGLTYQKITVTYTQGGITASDDWQAKVN